MTRPSRSPWRFVILVPAMALSVFHVTACRGSQTGAEGTAAATAKTEADVPLIPRQLIFGNPEKTGPVLSDDGSQLAFRAPVDGVMNVWVAPSDKLDAARPVTNDKSRGIRQFSWASTSKHILYLQDKGGDENWRVYAVDLTTGETKDLTPFDKVAAQIQQVSDKFPTDILVALNDRKPEFHDVHRINILTGKRTLVQRNDGGFAGFLTDDDYNVRLALQQRPDGGMDILQRAANGSFAPFESVGPDDSLTTFPVGFDASGQTLYVIDSRGRDTAVLVGRNMASGASTVLAQDARTDAENAIAHPKTGVVQAVAFNYDRVRWQVVDQAIAPDLEVLEDGGRRRNQHPVAHARRLPLDGGVCERRRSGAFLSLRPSEADSDVALHEQAQTRINHARADARARDQIARRVDAHELPDASGLDRSGW